MEREHEKESETASPYELNMASKCTCDSSRTASAPCFYCTVIARTHDLIISNLATAHPEWCLWICSDCEVPRFTKNQMEKHCVEVHKCKKEEVIYRANPSMDEIVKKLMLSCVHGQQSHLLQNEQIPDKDKLDENAAFYYQMLFSQSSSLDPPLFQPSTNSVRPLLSTAPLGVPLWIANSKDSSSLNEDIARNAEDVSGNNSSHQSRSTPQRVTLNSELELSDVDVEAVDVEEVDEDDNINCLTLPPKQQLPFSPASMTTSPPTNVLVQPVKKRGRPKSLPGAPKMKYKKKQSGVVKDPAKKEKKARRRFTCKKCFASVVHGQFKMHCYQHLYRDENLILFSCTFPGCGYTHYTASSVSLHLLNFHHSNTKSYKIKNNITNEIEQRAMELVNQYFDGDKKDLTEDDDSGSIVMNVPRQNRTAYIDSDSD